MRSSFFCGRIAAVEIIPQAFTPGARSMGLHLAPRRPWDRKRHGADLAGALFAAKTIRAKVSLIFAAAAAARSTVLLPRRPATTA